MLSTRSLCLNLLGVFVLLFNVLLVYSLAVNQGSVSGSMWNLLVARAVFGILYFLVVSAQRWIARSEGNGLFWIFLVYFVLLFGFAMMELITLTRSYCADESQRPIAVLSLFVFAWFFVVMDWLVVFALFVMGVLVYDNPFSFMLGGNTINHNNDNGDHNEQAMYDINEPDDNMRPLL